MVGLMEMKVDYSDGFGVVKCFVSLGSRVVVEYGEDDGVDIVQVIGSEKEMWDEDVKDVVAIGYGDDY